jgi:retinol dehydrogenase 12
MLTTITLCSGVMATPIERLTKNDYDLQFGTNVLGHFHLTALLLPALLAAPEPRVINVSSMGHNYPQSGGIHFETLKGPKKGTWFPLLSLGERYKYYGQSKLVRIVANIALTELTRVQGNILHANELARRYGDKGLVAISVHPGFVKTDLMRNHSGLTTRIAQMASITTEQGALTQLFAANSPDAKNLSGKASHYAYSERLVR